VLFTVAVTTGFVLGLYSLVLASVNAAGVASEPNAGLVRTATPADADLMAMVLGDLADKELVYVVLDTAAFGPDQGARTAARRAAEDLADSEMITSVRFLSPADSQFTTIVAENGIGRFPAALVVKRDGGIVLVTHDISEESLKHAYMTVWGTASSCEDAGSAIY
jgi:hypothetical protein